MEIDAAYRATHKAYASLIAIAELEGKIEQEFHSPFSVPVMDAGFDFNSLLLSEAKTFITETLSVTEPLARMKVVSTVDLPIDKTTYAKLRSSTHLYLVRGSDNKLNVLIFMDLLVQ